MSVNTGGFFFSNPTSTHLPPTSNSRDEDDQENWSRNTPSGTPTMSVGGYGINGSGQGVVNGYNAGTMQHQQQQQQQQQQQLMNTIQIAANNNNLIPNPLAAMNANMNNMNTINSHGIIPNPLANMGNNNSNNNNNTIGKVNNPLQNNTNNAMTTGLGSFFFNPLALFTNNTNNNNNNNHVTIPNITTVNNPLNNNKNATATSAPVVNALTANFLNANAMLNSNNTVSASAILNGTAPSPSSNNNNNNNNGTTNLGQSNIYHPNTHTNMLPATNLLANMNHHSNYNDATMSTTTNAAPSPLTMAFVTPLTTANPTPPPPVANTNNGSMIMFSSHPSELFLDAKSVLTADGASVVGGGDGGGGFGDEGNDDLNGENRATSLQENPQQRHRQQASSSSNDTNGPPTSIILRGISSMGSALAGVATYVNQSFLSGIPFHIADRAMKESKVTYAKWWEDGINDNIDEAGNKKRKGSTDEEDNGDDSDEDHNVEKNRVGSNNRPGKKRRLNSSSAVSAAASGSVLSNSLKKHYDDMGIDTTASFVEYRHAQLEQGQQPSPTLLLSTQHHPPSATIEVDSSIIAPRRRNQFEKATPAAAASSSSMCAQKQQQQAGGYNAFNNIGGMYDFGGNLDGQHQQEGQNNPHDGGGVDHGVIDSIFYDSLGSYFTTNEDLIEDNTNGGSDYNAMATGSAASVATANNHALPAENMHNTAIVTPLNNNNTTTLDDNDDDPTADPTPLIDGTMNAIQALLEEKNRASEENEMLQMLSSPRDWIKKSIRSELIDALHAVQGDVTDKRFLSSLEVLSNFYKTSGRDARVSPWSSGGRRRRKTYDDDDDDDECSNYVGNDDDELGGPTAADLFEGNWVNMSRPNYVECLGQNTENDFLYTLGRMSFDMFRPGNLVCSVQSTHNTIKIVGEREELPECVPKSLKEEVASLCDAGGVGEDGAAKKRPLLRSYDIAVSLTIEPPELVGQPKPPATPTPAKRMRAIQSVKGYVLPDPEIPNRLTVWFTGGKLSPARLASNGDGGETDDEDQADYNHQTAAARKAEEDLNDEYGDFENWKAMFAKGKWRKTLGERARAMAAKLLLGADVPNKMEEDGHMEYVLHRPVGGHGKVYVDVLYLDEDILIMRGHHGTIYAMARSGVSQRFRAIDGNQPSNSDEH